jgi:hypothetical protein
MRRLGDTILVYGSHLENGGAEIVALDADSGGVIWTEPMGYGTLVIGVDPANDAFYAGGDQGPGHPALRRFVRNGSGFSLDATFSPTLTGFNGQSPSVLGLDVIGGRVYAGGNFSKIDGVSRQGLARFKADGTLDSWAPKLTTELKIASGTPVELRPKFFREIGSRTVVGGSFLWYPDDVGSTLAGPPLLVYDSTTGARIRPSVGSGSWFGATYSEASDAAVLGSSLYVALGDSGIAAFDTATFDYQSFKSVRTFSGWGNNAIYALITKPGSVALASDSATTAAIVDPSLVVGGDLPRWKTRTAGNVVGLSAGVLNTDRTAPTVSGVGAKPRTDTTLGSGLPFWISWTGADKGGAGVSRYEVGQSRNGGAWTVLKVKVTSPRLAVSLASGSTYRFRVRAVDRSGNVGAWSYSTTAKAGLTQQTSSRLSWSSGWHTTTSSSYSGGSARYAKAAGSRVSYTLSARAIALVTTAGPTRGKAKIYVDGSLVKTIDLKASKTTYRYVAWYRQWSSSSKNTVKVVVLGTSGRPRVDVDGFVYWK